MAISGPTLLETASRACASASMSDRGMSVRYSVYGRYQDSVCKMSVYTSLRSSPGRSSKQRGLLVPDVVEGGGFRISFSFLLCAGLIDARSAPQKVRHSAGHSSWQAWVVDGMSVDEA